MSDCQRSPNGLRGVETSASADSKQRPSMELNSGVSTHPCLSSMNSMPEKENKYFPNPYLVPGGLGAMMVPSFPLVNQDIMNQKLLAQMQMLSFYHNQLYQKKLQEDSEEQQKIWVEQERLKDMEDKRQEAQRLSMIKQKPKEQESAIASDEVKLHLRSALLSKQRRQNSVNGEIGTSAWKHSQSSASPPSTIPDNCTSPPYRVAGSGYRGSYDPEFPIRKTASEPNLKVKAILKQKLAQDRQNSPSMGRRRVLEKHSMPLSVDVGAVGEADATSTLLSMPLKLGSTPAIHKELKAAKRTFEETRSDEVQQQMPENLFISMPNIMHKAVSLHSPLVEPDVRAQHSAKYGLPANSHMMLQAPFHPSIAGISEEDFYHSLGAFTALHDARRLAHPYRNKGIGIPEQPPITQRHPRHQKPLSRTQSAPLPMVHPGLTANIMLGPQQQALLEHQQLVKQHQDQILKEKQKKMVIGQLRQTLLQRSSSKSHMENVDEESENRLILEMQESCEDAFESHSPYNMDKHLHMSHGSISAATAAAAAAAASEHSSGLDLSTSTSLRKYSGRYLPRTHSSPLVSFTLPAPSSEDIPINLAARSTNEIAPDATGVCYDEAMLRHFCPCSNNGLHLENPGRIQSIWTRLTTVGLVDRCKRIEAKKATIEQLQLCHSESYSLFFGVNTCNRKRLGLELANVQFQPLSCGGIGVDSDTVWNEEHSAHAARVATGCVIELASRVYEKQLKNGMAIVRPPGHHAEHGQAMGFCFFNSIAIAAKHLKHKLGASRILILDWDVHHGNGTQQMTYDDPCILYLSLHRHDNGNFFPGTGDLADCGERQGLGFNVNIAFSGGLDPPMGDAEYMAAFRAVVMPIVNEFKPQIILVSAGFDGADGHAPPLGGYKISPACFGFMAKQLMGACEGRVVLVLEGGYNIASMCDSSEMCMRALLGESVPLPSEGEIMRRPCATAVKTLNECVDIQSQFWPLDKHRSRISMSFVDSLRQEKEETDALSAMASLSMLTARSAPKHALPADSEPMEEA